MKCRQNVTSANFFFKSFRGYATFAKQFRLEGTNNFWRMKGDGKDEEMGQNSRYRIAGGKFIGRGYGVKRSASGS